MSNKNETPTSTPRAFTGLIGIARRDITPPVGIYSRLWGAAKHDVAEGVHRPMTATAIAFRQSHGETASPLVLISVDLCHFPEDGEVVQQVLANLGLERSALMIACSHTHSSVWLGHDRESLAGGDLLPGYNRTLVRQITAAAHEAIDAPQAATVTWGTGRCALAANRDFPDPNTPGRFVCGFNPNVEADDTVLVGRITRDEDGAVLGTIVNYACHPTTLGWDNRLLSPDYIGAMREVVEQSTADAPCAFLQGASGDLAPAHQYVGDVAIADRHGRALGHAVLSALAMMLPPRRELYYAGAVESGTPLGMWRTRPFEPSDQLDVRLFDVEMPLKKSAFSDEEIAAQLHVAADERITAERLRRREGVRRSIGGRTHMNLPVWTWRIGDAVLVGFEAESYSIFQRDLRQAFPDAAVVVINVVNGGIGYVYPPELAGETNLYQVWQSPFSPAALPLLTRACETSFRALLTNNAGGAELVATEQKS